MFIFCRLKINHDSHEFILKSGTIVNNYNVYAANTDIFLSNEKVASSSSSKITVLYAVNLVREGSGATVPMFRSRIAIC